MLLGMSMDPGARVAMGRAMKPHCSLGNVCDVTAPVEVAVLTRVGSGGARMESPTRPLYGPTGARLTQEPQQERKIPLDYFGVGRSI